MGPGRGRRREKKHKAARKEAWEGDGGKIYKNKTTQIIQNGTKWGKMGKNGERCAGVVKAKRDKNVEWGEMGKILEKLETFPPDEVSSLNLLVKF